MDIIKETEYYKKNGLYLLGVILTKTGFLFHACANLCTEYYPLGFWVIGIVIHYLWGFLASPVCY